MKAISYALFGYNKERHADCFDFNSYLRGLNINIRMNRLLFPDWEIILNTDQSTYEGFKNLFDRLPITVKVHEPAPLCKAMLWRMKPIFELNSDNKWKYDYVLCRDLDSPPTYREVQAVSYWMMRDKAMHAITDSVSHDVPLLGGMIGVIPKYFTQRVGNTWEAMLGDNGIDFSRKGSDQNFLNHYIYPKFATKGQDSITQHYFNGYANTFLSDYHTCTCPPTAGHKSDCPNNTEVSLPYNLADSNSVCGHIGAAGYYETAMFKFLRQYWHEFDDLLVIEKDYSNIFYWANA